MGWVQAGIELGEEFLNLPIFSGHALHLFLGPFMPFQLPDSSLSIPLVVLYALTVFSLVLFTASTCGNAVACLSAGC